MTSSTATAATSQPRLANLQNFIAQKKDLILLTPSGDGIIPGIKVVNDAEEFRSSK